MHFVIYLPSGFYAGIASSIVEILQAINSISPSKVFTFEFVSPHLQAISRSGISFPAKKRPSRKSDVLILLAGAGAEVTPQLHLLDVEAKQAMRWIKPAQRGGSIIAATCGAAYLLAASGLLDGKRATISWWLKEEVQERFPQVHWEPAHLIVRQENIYTSGGGFSGLELITTLLTDLGYSKEVRLVRKLMVLPPSRQFQSPYEISPVYETGAFEKSLNRLVKDNIQELDLPFLSRQLKLSPRTLSRKFMDELGTSPGKWIQEKRIGMAKTLLEGSKLNISEICYRVGYEDLASFSRLFSNTTGMTPVEFRKEIQPKK